METIAAAERKRDVANRWAKRRAVIGAEYRHVKLSRGMAPGERHYTKRGEVVKLFFVAAAPRRRTAAMVDGRIGARARVCRNRDGRNF